MMNELRYDPVKDIKVVIANSRQDRTFLPSLDFCPLCPSSTGKVRTEIPDTDYDIVVFENKFPTFKNNDDYSFDSESGFYKNFEARGICEVVCYSSSHDKYLEDYPVRKIENLIKVWTDRYYNLGIKDFVKYILIFENKGREIGVTLSHPHGQIYAFSYIPPTIRKELKNSKRYFENNGKCLHCNIIEAEISKKDRIVYQNESFVAFIPYYARWPYEVHLYSLRHFGSFCSLDKSEVTLLSEALKNLINRYNKLFNFRMPYVMVVHQSPTDGKDYSYYHFHFEFYPPYRTKSKLKYLAGCELGAGSFINDTIPEEKARELRNIRV